jgi:glutathione reductase (NADPH)
VHLVVTAMSGGMTVAQLARIPFAYPTYGAIVRQAARRMLGERHEGELSA